MDTERSDVLFDLFDKGFGTAEMSYRSKKPPKGSKWKELTQRRMTEEEVRELCKKERINIALICGQQSGIVAIDADTRENARRLYEALPRTAAMQQTPNGGHLLYQWPEGAEIPPSVKTTIKGIQCDIRGEASYIVIAPSIHPTGKPYRWVNWPWNLDDVPEFDPEWIDNTDGKRPLTRDRVKNVDGYLARVESIQGKHGSSGLVRAAAVCRDAGLSEAEAMAKLMVWNQGPTVNPPWSTEELARAITRTYAKVEV